MFLPAVAIALATTTTSGAMALHKLLRRATRMISKGGKAEELLEAEEIEASSSNSSSEKQNGMQPEIVPLPEPSIVVCGGDTNHGTAENETESEFELWVETKIDAGWCLEDDRNAENVDWQKVCSTSTMKRSWVEFEALAKIVEQPSYRPALEQLGLSQEASVSNSDVSAAFRRLAKERHPDKGGSREAFAKLVDARRAALDLCLDM